MLSLFWEPYGCNSFILHNNPTRQALSLSSLSRGEKWGTGKVRIMFQLLNSKWYTWNSNSGHLVPKFILLTSVLEQNMKALKTLAKRNAELLSVGKTRIYPTRGKCHHTVQREVGQISFLSSKWSKVSERPPRPFLVWNVNSSTITSLGQSLATKTSWSPDVCQTPTIVLPRNTWGDTNEVKQIEDSMIDAITNVHVHRKVINFILGYVGSQRRQENSWHLIKVLRDGRVH